MGEIIKRPFKEGVGEKPATPKPYPDQLKRSLGGAKPMTPKPLPAPQPAASSQAKTPS